MPALTLKIVIGFLVGTLIGLTGLGGGVLLLPLLIFVLKVPAIMAVGSDALFNFVTKIGAGWLHLRKGTVRRKVVLAMAVGSIPGFNWRCRFSYSSADPLWRGSQRLHQVRSRVIAGLHSG